MPKRTAGKKPPQAVNAKSSRRDQSLRKHLLALLDSSEAHLNFSDAVAAFAPVQRGIRPPGAAHTAWQLLEHLRICQWDILEFSRNPTHASLSWPEGYWPATDAPTSEEAWDQSIAAFRADLRAMRKLIADPRRDLFARVHHPEAEAKHTLLREALLLADHNAYHIGQLVLLRRVLGAL
ncbi:MAG: DinB family protein [Candidatus Acidiferrales bacterium]